MPELRLRDCRNLRDALLDFCRGLEEDFDDGNPVQRLRLNVLDIVNRRGKRALRLADDPIAHLLRVQPTVIPDDADDGNINVGENVSGRAVDDDRAQD